MLKDLLKQQSNSPPSPSKTILDQIIKGHYRAQHNTALLAQENANLSIANEKVVKKRNRSTREISCEEGLTVEEPQRLWKSIPRSSALTVDGSRSPNMQRCRTSSTNQTKVLPFPQKPFKARSMITGSTGYFLVLAAWGLYRPLLESCYRMTKIIARLALEDHDQLSLVMVFLDLQCFDAGHCSYLHWSVKVCSSQSQPAEIRGFQLVRLCEQGRFLDPLRFFGALHISS